MGAHVICDVVDIEFCFVIYLFEQVEVLAATKLMWTCYNQ